MTDIGVAAVVGFLYFTLNTLGLLAVAYYCFVHVSTSDAFLAYYWKRKSIFISLMVVFLDAATDLTVLITWYDLVEVEDDLAEVNDGEGFDSVNMKTFFWPLLGFWAMYQVILAMMQCDSHHLWDMPLVICQLYPFRAAYLSLQQDPVGEQARKAAKMREAQLNPDAGAGADAVTITPMQSAEDPDEDDQKAQVEPETPGDTEDGGDGGAKRVNTEEVDRAIMPELKGPQSISRQKTSNPEIGPGEAQSRMLLVQCVFETVPGLVLQSVFFCKSFNDEYLRDNSNAELILLSIVISLLSVAARFVTLLDKQWVQTKARGGCFRCRAWYYLRSVYRLCSILACFIVFVLMWVVVGGLWIGLWATALFVLWKVATYIVGEEVCSSWAFAHSVRNMIGLSLEYSWKWHCLKFAENVIGMSVIFALLYSDADGGSVVSLETRLLYREDNDRIQALAALGWLSAIGALGMYLFMLTHDAILEEQQIVEKVETRRASVMAGSSPGN